MAISPIKGLFFFSTVSPCSIRVPADKTRGKRKSDSDIPLFIFSSSALPFPSAILDFLILTIRFFYQIFCSASGYGFYDYRKVERFDCGDLWKVGALDYFCLKGETRQV